MALIDKVILSEKLLFTGDIKMPGETFVDRKTIKESKEFSREHQIVNQWIMEHIESEFFFKIVNIDYWCDASEKSVPLLQVNPMDYKNSPDYVMLYGVDVEDCDVNIYYDDNRRKGKVWNISLNNNKFIVFPSTCMYYIDNLKERKNYILTILYERMG